MAGVNTGNPGPEASAQQEAPGSSQQLPSAQQLALIEEARAVQEKQKRKAEKREKKKVRLHSLSAVLLCFSGSLRVFFACAGKGKEGQVRKKASQTSRPQWRAITQTAQALKSERRQASQSSNYINSQMSRLEP